MRALLSSFDQVAPCIVPVRSASASASEWHPPSTITIQSQIPLSIQSRPSSNGDRCAVTNQCGNRLTQQTAALFYPVTREASPPSPHRPWRRATSSVPLRMESTDGLRHSQCPCCSQRPKSAGSCARPANGPAPVSTASATADRASRSSPPLRPGGGVVLTLSIQYTCNRPLL